MKKNLTLLHFNYELYDNSNKNHLDFFDELWQDEETQKYLYNKDEFINNIINGTNEYDCIYLVKIDKELIGFVSIYYSDNTYKISDGILPRYREKGYSTKLLNEFSSYIFSSTNIDTLYSYIDKNNTSSINSVLKNGFVQTDEKEYVLKNK